MHSVCWKVGVYVYLCEALHQRLQLCVSCFFVYVIMLLTHVQKADCRWVWCMWEANLRMRVCMWQQEGGRQTDTACQGVFRSIQTDDPLHPSLTPTIQPPPSLLTVSTPLTSLPHRGLYTMFSPRLACHLLAQDFRMDVIDLKLCFHLQLDDDKIIQNFSSRQGRRGTGRGTMPTTQN